MRKHCSMVSPYKLLIAELHRQIIFVAACPQYALKLCMFLSLPAAKDAMLLEVVLVLNYFRGLMGLLQDQACLQDQVCQMEPLIEIFQHFICTRT